MKRRVEPTRRRVEPIILQAAIKLFGLYTYNGVTLKDLTKEARVQEPAIYLWFENKENLYAQAVNAVVAHATQEFSNFVVKLFAGSGEPTAARIAEVVGEWYSSIPEAYVRLLHQVLVSDQRRDAVAREPLEKVVEMIAKSLEHRKKTSRKFDPQSAAMVLVRSLLWGKVHASKTADRDSDKILQFWVQSLMPV